MGKQFGYKKYMKKEAQADKSLWYIFVASFFGMLLIFTFLMKSFSPSVDTSIGDYRQENEYDTQEETKKIVDDRLSMIQSEDQGKSFSEIMSKASDDENSRILPNDQVANSSVRTPVDSSQNTTPQMEPVYKVFVGSYTSAEQAKVAKDIIQESANGLNPIVKCIGSNNYTLQVGIFKNKQSAETLLYAVQQNHLPGRIVQDY